MKFLKCNSRVPIDGVEIAFQDFHDPKVRISEEFQGVIFAFHCSSRTETTYFSNVSSPLKSDANISCDDFQRQKVLISAEYQGGVGRQTLEFRSGTPLK